MRRCPGWVDVPKINEWMLVQRSVLADIGNCEFPGSYLHTKNQAGCEQGLTIQCNLKV